MSQEELVEQNRLQNELIKSLLHLGKHLERRVLMTSHEDLKDVGSLMEFVAEMPNLMEQRLINFKTQGLKYEE